MITVLIAVLVPVVSLLVSLLMAARWVHAREAIVVLRKTTGRVVSAHGTPGLYLVLPFLDEVRAVDLTFHRSRRDGLSVVTSDSVTLMVSLTIAWEMNGAWLEETAANNPAELDRVLPFLDDAEGIVLNWTELVLRGNISQRHARQVQDALQGTDRYIHVLRDQIAARVAILGVRVLDLTLFCYPAPGVIAARAQAEAQAQTITQLAKALGPRSDDLLRVMTLELLREQNGRVFTSVDMGEDGHGRIPVQFLVGPE